MRESAGFRGPGIIIRFLITALALAVAAWIVPGITADNIGALLIAALIFGIVNALIKPVLTLLTCPLIILTLGLFTFIINAAMLMLTDWVATQLDVRFSVENFGAALIGAVIVTIVSWALTVLTE
jgi:putative membrane protein